MKTKLKLELPGWIPDEVGKRAVEILEWLRSSATDEEISLCLPVLKRLATDPLMQSVWEELKKRKRDEHYHRTEFHSHPATFFPEVAAARKIDPQDRLQYQQVAMSALFSTTLWLATLPLVVRKRSLRRPFVLLRLEAARRFDDIEVDFPPEFSTFTDPVVDVARRLFRKSQMSLWHVILCQEEVTLMVTRDTIRDPRTRCVGIGVAGLCEQWFGSELYGTASKLTEVATGKTVKLAQLRQWCREVEPLPHDLQAVKQ